MKSTLFPFVKKGLPVLASLTFTLGLTQSFASDKQALKTINARGVDGEHASDGSRGSDGSNGSGGDGSNGTDAGRSTKGTSAGKIDVTLSHVPGSTPEEGSLIIRGTVDSPTQGHGGVDEKLKIGKQGHVFLDARGGDGGNGGVGGRGGNGGRGSSGSDATQYSSGTNGGDGGDGGNGGYGSDGSDAGHGGKVTVHVNEADTDLPVLVEHDVDGGKGGKAGSHGRGGDGGSGGSGGSSYSWTETETESYTDSEGNSQTRTNTTYHSNPGGWSGSNGHSGSTPSSTLHAGADGKLGQFAIQVHRPDGTVESYDQRHNLQVVELTMSDANGDGIFEPGEKVTVKNIKVRNAAGANGMPTPAHQKITIHLDGNNWVLADHEQLILPKSLKPGEEYSFGGSELHFTIHDVNITKPSQTRFSETGDLHPRSQHERVARLGEDPMHSRFEVTFPLEITPIDMVRSVGNGEASTITWNVKNISGKTYGSVEELKREIALQLRHAGGEVKPDQVVFRDSRGHITTLDQHFLESVAHLAPGESVKIEGTIGLKTSPAYNSAKLNVDLQLSDVKDKSKKKVVQIQEATLQVAESYRNTPGSKYLLVTNSRTTRDEVDAWKKLTHQLGGELDTWNLSFHGYLNLAKHAETGSDLMKEFEGKTIILLENPYESSSGMERPLEQLAKRQFLEAASKYKINFYVVGNTSNLGSMLIPTTAENEKDHQKISDFLKSEKKSRALPPNFSEEFDKVEIHGRTLYGAVKPEDLQKKAIKLQDKLSRKYPDRRYIVVHDFDGTEVSNGVGVKEYRVGRNYRVGSLEIRRTLDKNSPAAMGLSVNEKALHTPDFVLGEANRKTLVASVPFKEKLEILKRLVKDGGKFANESDAETARATIRGILIDLAIEQDAARSRGDWALDYRRKAIREQLPKLQQLVEELPKGLKTLAAGGEATQLFHDFSYILDALVSSETSWLERLVPLRVDPRVTSVSKGYIQNFVRATLANAYGGPRKAWREVSDASSKLEKKFAERARARAKGEFHPLNPLAMDSETLVDTKVFAEEGSQVISSRSFTSEVAADQRAAATQEMRIKANRESRAMCVTRDLEHLLTR